jgi:hypothetical protein
MEWAASIPSIVFHPSMDILLFGVKTQGGMLLGLLFGLPESTVGPQKLIFLRCTVRVVEEIFTNKP